METGSAFEGMGVAREVSFAVLAEAAMIAAVLSLSVQSGSVSLATMLSPSAGAGAALLAAAEDTARACGKTLLVLDTASAEAERLYARAGWVRCGAIPGYALLPHGGLCATTFYYRELG